MLKSATWPRLPAWFLAALAVVALGGASVGDVIVLKNGNEIRGKITLDVPELIEVQVPYGTLQILRREIERIDKEGEAEYLGKTGERLLRHQDTEKGLALLRRSFELEPSTRTRQALVRALASIAETRLKQRRLVDTRKHIDEALVLSPTDSALLDVETRLESETTRQQSLAERAQVALAEAQHVVAFGILQELVRDFPDARSEWRASLAKAAVLVGHERLRANQYDGAADAYRVALRQEPDYIDLLSAPLALAETRAAVPLMEAGQFEQAKRRLTEVREFIPEHPAILYFLAVAAEGTGDIGTAAELYTRLTGPSRTPIRPDVHVAELRRSAEAVLSRAGKIELVSPRTRWTGHSAHPGTRQSQHFEISYTIAERARGAERQLEYHLARLQREWCRGSSVLAKRIHVFLHPNRDEFRSAVSPPEWSTAITRNERRFGRLLRQELHFDASDPQFESATIAHELCHVLLPHLVGTSKHVPLWIDEGIATSEEPRFKQDYFDRVVREALQSDSLFPLAELTSLETYPSPDRAPLFYAQSNSIIRFLRSKISMKSLFALISEAADGDLSTALSRHTRYGGLDHLERDWRSQLR